MSTSTVSVHDVVALVHLAGRTDVCDRAELTAGVDASERLMAWAEAQRLRFVAAMDADDALGALTGKYRSSTSEAKRTAKRAETAERSPEFSDALACGKVTAAHLDRLGESLARLEPGQRQQMLERTPKLVELASNATAGEFELVLRDEERALGREAGVDRLEQQRRDVRLRSWTDRATGMPTYKLTLDPVTGVKFNHAIQAVAEVLFHSDPLPDCPTDAEERIAFIRAHALLQLTDGKGCVKPGRPEMLVVVDATAPDRPPSIDWGLPVEIPRAVLDDLAGAADITTVVVRNGVVLHAPGRLDLGRATRLANRAQRRALRGLYRTCMVPGCSTHFDHCQIHHIHWWERGGRTDLANLGPVCNRHHHLIHDGGWIIRLGPHREITVVTPDGVTRGPPPKSQSP